jgi:hypothetical protein
MLRWEMPSGDAFGKFLRKGPDKARPIFGG